MLHEKKRCHVNPVLVLFGRTSLHRALNTHFMIILRLRSVQISPTFGVSHFTSTGLIVRKTERQEFQSAMIAPLTGGLCITSINK